MYPSPTLARFLILGGRVPIVAWIQDDDTGIFALPMWHGERPAALMLYMVAGIWGDSAGGDT